MATTELVCPKCNGAMRSYERSGVTVDQCGDCRGIFLDRGELEHLVDAEQGWQPQPPSREGSAPLRLPYGDRDDDDDDDDGRYGRGQQQRRKRSFFDDLFD